LPGMEHIAPVGLAPELLLPEARPEHWRCYRRLLFRLTLQTLCAL